MLCPRCKSELKPYKMRRLQTLEEHVWQPNDLPSLKMSYRCSSANCPTRIAGVVWNRDGELYYDNYAELKKIQFINNNNAPFGTSQRQYNVEIYKHDEERIFFNFPDIRFFPLRGWKIKLEWKYQSNKNGEILSKRPRFKWITKENVYHNWGMNMLIFCLKGHLRNWRMFKKDPKNISFFYNDLIETIKRKSWPDKEWWRIVDIFIAELLLKRLLKNLSLPES